MNEYQKKWLEARGHTGEDAERYSFLAPTSPEEGAERQHRGSAWQAEFIVNSLQEGNVDTAVTNVKNYLEGSGTGRSTITKLIALNVVKDFSGELADTSEENLKSARDQLIKIQRD